MGNITTLNNNSVSVSTDKDAIVIVKLAATKPGGASLDVTGFTPTSIGAGHVIIKETATGLLKPLGVTDGAYDSLPNGHTYEGIAIATVTKEKPNVGIMYAGTVNASASYPYPITSGIQAAIRLLRDIVFI